jgi:two-component system, chemotaxis family, chemotaxis protein CheY
VTGAEIQPNWDGPIMKKHKVLLVDDNLDLALIGQRVFSEAGYAFDSARTGAEGLEKLRLDPADVLILDRSLSDMSGGDFLQHLSGASMPASLRTLPVIILSARPGAAEDLQSMHPVGLRAVLTKPFGYRELAQVVDTILRQEAWRKPAAAISATPAGWESSHEVEWGLQTIAQLAQELKNGMTNEQNLIDLDAIYTASKRLQRLLKNDIPARVNPISDLALV